MKMDRKLRPNDKLYLRWSDKKKWWTLHVDRETFYDDDRYLMTWETAEEAMKWAEEYLGILPIVE